MVHVFVIGSKGIPAKYGGFETFVENLTARKKSEYICYHVSCMGNGGRTFVYNNAECFEVRTPAPGAVGRILHVALVLEWVLRWLKQYAGEKAIVYILGCRVGPLLIPYARQLRKKGITILCNPDGLEWKRDKWNKMEKRFLRLCEKCLVESSDLAICDSVNIEQYIHENYPGIPTKYIAYGSDLAKSTCSEDLFCTWCDKNGVSKGNYFLVVGRFVPENNLETIISEFCRSTTNGDLVIITNVEKNAFYRSIQKNTNFEQNSRVKFVGTVYEAELLKKIRENACAYIHGHEVGGTNPSLLEALGSTQVSLLLDVSYNREVGQNSALYWTKKPGHLQALLEHAEGLSMRQRKNLELLAKQRVTDAFSWEMIIESYEKTFEGIYENPAYFIS